MSVSFTAENHAYTSIDPTETIQWLSVTSFVGKFKEKFDPVTVSLKCSKNKKSKWYGMDPLEIQRIWSGKTDRAITTGSWYHEQRESDILGLSTIERSGRTLPIVQPIFDNGRKIAPIQMLLEGVYPEHFVYLKSAGLCGQADRVEVIKDTVDVIDYKTNEEIKMQGFINWEGISKKMLEPLNHLDDCNFNHYSLQLSTYMYIILKHNPHFKAGKMILQHIVFEKNGVDEFDNVILKRDDAGQPIVQEVIPYEVPYLKDEVLTMIKYIKQ